MPEMLDVFRGLMTSNDFEGYIALIGLALVLQATLTFMVPSRAPQRPRTYPRRS